MRAGALSWLSRPGLAGGIDKDGSRAQELLDLGFGSVEFGTVAAHPAATFGLAPLVKRLAALPARPDGGTAVGIGIGLPPETPPVDLPDLWLAGLLGAWPVADYVSFNLSAQAYRPLLAAEHLPLLSHALHTVAAARSRLPCSVALALKFPLGSGDGPLPAVALAAAATGFDCLTAVLPEDDGGHRRFAALAQHLPGTTALVAVGGIRCAADVAAVRAAGAAGVQVHRIFTERGPDCLPTLLGN